MTICNEGDDKYRFGFNGKEKDNEMKGVGNSLDFGARMYDGRLGRLNMSLDPLAKKFPSQSSYIFGGNNPIFYIDEEGKKKTVFNVPFDERNGKTTVTKATSSGLMSKQIPMGNGGSGSPFIRDNKYSWHDYTLVNYTSIDKNGKKTFSTNTIVETEAITKTEFNNETWAKTKTGDYTNDFKKMEGKFSGYIYTSKYGGGDGDNKYNPSGSKGTSLVNVDGIMAAFGFAGSGGTVGKDAGLTDALSWLNGMIGVSGTISNNNKTSSDYAVPSTDTFSCDEGCESGIKTDSAGHEQHNIPPRQVRVIGIILLSNYYIKANTL